MVKPILLLSACAMLIGVAVGEQFPKPYSCETFADLVKAESELPNEPPVMRVEQKISGEDAIVQFPDHPDKELEGKTFTYSVTLDNCKPVVNSFASLVQTDPSETRTKTRNTSELNKAVKFDRYLAGLYRRLSVKPAKIDISRGREYVNVPGVNFRAGDKAQMCLAAPGWECTASVQLKDRRSKKTIINMPYKEPTFFPAIQNRQSLIKSTWVVLRNS